MTYPIPVLPPLEPILVEPTTPEADSSMIVTFQVPTATWNTSILLHLCIKIKIGGVTIYIYYSKYVLANGSTYDFNSLLPVDSVIEDVRATYTVARRAQ